VQHSEEAGAEILQAAVGIDQLLLIPQRDRHRVHREIPAAEVVADRCRVDLRQGAGAGVGLGARLGDIDLELAELQPARQEEALALQLEAGNAGERLGIALDGDIEVGALDSNQRSRTAPPTR
jgi:hypothetical protein